MRPTIGPRAICWGKGRTEGHARRRRQEKDLDFCSNLCNKFETIALHSAELYDIIGLFQKGHGLFAPAFRGRKETHCVSRRKAK